MTNNDEDDPSPKLLPLYLLFSTIETHSTILGFYAPHNSILQDQFPLESNAVYITTVGRIRQIAALAKKTLAVPTDFKACVLVQASKSCRRSRQDL
ncbi:hypothetical protein V5O48_015856 [Marasmius crinis-equi]|uniref:Uncharacterized protein n=1 Tax=Marasmius crinis-equi TaxID=585013 RepID=A0ABR3ETE5_9AGAR